MDGMADCNVMDIIELRYLFGEWPDEMVNQLYIEMIDDSENGFY